MPLLQITADDALCPRLHGSSAALQPALVRALSLPSCGGGPIVVMVHGYRYQPGHPTHCPHGSLLSLSGGCGSDGAISWPQHLGFGRGEANEGLALAFGWSARGSIWQAARSAGAAGTALARLVAALHRIAPTRPLHIIAHSLGCRVALSALAQSGPGTVNRLLLLAAAEFCTTARAALNSPAGTSAEILNVTSRENDLFDGLMEALMPPPRPGDRMLGHGSLSARNLVTLQLDHPGALRALRQHGYPIRPAARRICHWSPYSRPGIFHLYRSLLSGHLSLEQLRALLPRDTAPRWSRLVPPPLLRTRVEPPLHAPPKPS
ncbi:alpha/beta hydrolase [Puniceibacterium confluentis]|uniref:alpha/beta hydrolase n=2 Tax=Puniceibacterium confluentis TaxID=1958944 RepID=UPI0011B84DF6|nr:alpha/beta hydrolase [Puniceibacterium confluentis]